MQKMMTEFQGLMGASLEMSDSLLQHGVMPLTENLRVFSVNETILLFFTKMEMNLYICTR